MDQAPRLHQRLPLLAGLMVVVAIVTAGCEIQEPVMPTFSTRLSVPIGSHEITVQELIEDQDFLSAGADSVLSFSIDGDTTSVVLDVDFSAELQGEHIDTEIGPISLPIADPVDFGFVLDDLYPGASSLPPGPTSVPAFDFDLVSDAAALDDIVSALVASGELRLTLINNLPIPLSGSSPPERITVSLIDPASGTVLAVGIFPAALAPGDSTVAVADLAGATLPGDIAIALTGGSPGGFAANGLDIADGLDVRLELVDVMVDAATAIVDAQQFEDGGSIALPDDLLLVSAVLASGVIAVDLSNELPIPCTVTLDFPEITLADGSPLTIPLDLPAGGTNATIVELADAVVNAPAGTSLSSLSWTVTATSPGSGTDAVVIAATDRLSAVLAPTTFVFAEITGTIPEERFVLDPTTEHIDLPDELDGLQLASATLTLEIFNGTGVGGSLDVLLTGTSADGTVSTLAAVALIGADDTKELRTVVVLDETNSDIAAFLSALPETVTLEGEISVGGDGQVGTIRPGDGARLTWGLDAPLRLVIQDSRIDQEPVSLDLDEETRRQLDDHLVQAEVLAEVTNHFPFAVELFIQVGPDSVSAMEDPELVIGPLSIAAGDLDPLGGWVSRAADSQLEIPLAAEDIRAFTRPGAYTAVVARIPGSNGEQIVIRIGDRLSLRGAISAEILIADLSDESP